MVGVNCPKLLSESQCTYLTKVQKYTWPCLSISKNTTLNDLTLVVKGRVALPNRMDFRKDSKGGDSEVPSSKCVLFDFSQYNYCRNIP